jgi:prefoldin subunit 5
MAIIQSPLARSLQGGLIQSRVSGGVFGGGGFTGSGASGVDEDGNKQILENNQSLLADISTGINGIRIQISALNDSLNSIATRITNDSTLESTMAQADQDYQRKLSERQVRIGQESALESKIQAALTKPVVALQNKVSSVFGNVGNALRTLFLGWLLNQGIEALQANAEENKEKLISIRNEVLKAFAFVIAGGGILAIIKAAIVGLTRSVIGLAARIGGFVVKGLFLRPFQLVIDALKGMMGKIPRIGAPAAPPSVVPPGGVKPGAGGKPGGVKPGGVKPGGGKPAGGLGTGLLGIKDIFTGDPFGGLLAGGSFLPGPAGKAFKAAAWGKELLFDSGAVPSLFGGSKDKSTTPESSSAPAPVAKSQPMQTPMGAMAAQPAAAPTYAAPASLPTQEINIMNMGLTPSPKTSDEKTQPKPKEKEKETTKPTTDVTKNVKPAAMMTPAETKPAETKPAEITPAQTQAVPKEMPNVGPAAKPKPNVIVAAAPSQNRSSAPPKSSAPATQVPNISSSNPDNFYALYSQLNYNVVI